MVQVPPPARPRCPKCNGLLQIRGGVVLACLRCETLNRGKAAGESFFGRVTPPQT